MNQAAGVLTAEITVAVGIATFIAAGVRQYLSREPATSPPTPDALWLPCHQPTCGHMTTPHDPTPAGPPTCRWCTEATNGGQP